MGKTVTIRRPDGQELQGYLAEPEKNTGNAPGIVVLQEWWGLNGQIRAVADRLASAGYLALVPDLYRGKSTVEQEEASHLMNGLDFADAASQDVRGAIQYLQSRASKVGSMGFCMGGALVIMSAVCNPELDAAVTFYGFPPLEYIDPQQIKVPLQGHWATQDQHFKLETVAELETMLDNAGVALDFHRYLAPHAFANEEAVGNGRMPTSQYDPVWARQAWDRTLTFFGKHLFA
ncbi:dienelactone hydrolase family protein [Janthinobacterium agaricidamnosum]|uniref:Dienelactone hydrolase family protein n=1 Tax=Janthinobacterium agaricidamnosum NBRC 102515 = DSM 9628 TaxID=1349767 RepID=W0V136_9BURK|nr:dienelactone hydrolase family protein [Janthinobacterium agaricidamnosum]CDG80987.1 dienelactone hydrolase family protein [Janthinobacterium agaricidamnosum NBRC 102515 = DSM 9628]